MPCDTYLFDDGYDEQRIVVGVRKAQTATQTAKRVDTGGHTGPLWTHARGLMAVLPHGGTLWTHFHQTLDQVVGIRIPVPQPLK